MEEWIAWNPVKLNSEYFYVSMSHVSDGFAKSIHETYQHFAIFTSDALIDVISVVEPVIEFED